jgi:hypothetical protein
MRRRTPEPDFWKPSVDRGFREVESETYAGLLDGRPCSIAMVPVMYGFLGVLLRVEAVAPFRGTLYRREGRVARNMFSDGVSPDVRDPRFAAAFGVISDGSTWRVSDAACESIEALHLEYVQADTEAISVLWMSEVPPDGLALERASALIRALVPGQRAR